jgi:hypothetical protein
MGDLYPGNYLFETSFAPLPKELTQKAMLITANIHLYRFN